MGGPGAHPTGWVATIHREIAAGRVVGYPGRWANATRGDVTHMLPEADLEALLATIREHEGEELDAVQAYRELADHATDRVIRSLLRMLVDDEEHHHRVLAAIAMEVRALQSAGGRDVPIPPRAMDDAAVEQVRELAAREGKGAAELRDIANRAPGLDGGLVALLLGLMAFDSEKHQLILRYVLQELEAARTGQTG